MSNNNHNMIGEQKELASCTPGAERPVAAPVVGAAASPSSGPVAVPSSPVAVVATPEVNGPLGEGGGTLERAGLASPGRRPEEFEAEELLRAPNLLDLFVRDVQATGLVGEEDNIKRLLLVAVSRRLPHPLGAIVKGSSGTGKSNLAEAVLAHTDAKQMKDLTRITAKALGHMGDELMNKLVYLDEAVGVESCSHELRVLFSKKKLTTRQPNEELEVQGPIAFITTTTAFGLDGELESRMFELSMDESAAQSKRIVGARRKAAGRSAATLGAIAHRKVVWGEADRMLVPVPVVVAEDVSAPIEAAVGTGLRARRNVEKLISAVRAHALLHQRQRDVVDGVLVAQHQDVEAVLEIFRPVLQPLPVRLTSLASDLADNFDKKPFEASEAASATGRHPDVVRRELQELAKWGLVTVESPGRGKRPGTWKVARPCHRPARLAVGEASITRNEAVPNDALRGGTDDALERFDARPKSSLMGDVHGIPNLELAARHS